MEHQVHAADAQHGHARVAVVAGNRLVCANSNVPSWASFRAGDAVRVALLVVGQVARVGVGFEQVLPGIDQEAAGARRRDRDALRAGGVDHFHHHADDVARRAELAVGAGGIELGQQVFVEVALRPGSGPKSAWRRWLCRLRSAGWAC